MKLNPFHRVKAVPDPHDDPFGGAGRYLQDRGQTFFFHHQGMVAGGQKSLF